MTFDQYVQMMLQRGDVSHSVDRGILSVFSDIVDTIGVVSIVAA